MKVNPISQSLFKVFCDDDGQLTSWNRNVPVSWKYNYHVTGLNRAPRNSSFFCFTNIESAMKFIAVGKSNLWGTPSLWKVTGYGNIIPSSVCAASDLQTRLVSENKELGDLFWGKSLFKKVWTDIRADYGAVLFTSRIAQPVSDTVLSRSVRLTREITLRNTEVCSW
jgi:hypothetical protein